MSRCIVCDGTDIVCHRGEYVCTDCGATQTQFRNEAVEEECDMEGAKTMFMKDPGGEGQKVKEHRKNESQLIAKLQSLLAAMGESAAVLIGLRPEAVAQALEVLFFAYLTRYLRAAENARSIKHGRLSRRKKHLLKVVDGLVRNKDREFDVHPVPLPSQALFLALLWQGLVASQAPVLATDVVDWFAAGRLGTTPRQLQEALRAFLRPRSRQRKHFRRTSTWHMCRRGPPIKATDVQKAAELFIELGLPLGRLNEVGLLRRLLEVTGLAAVDEDGKVESAATWYLVIASLGRRTGMERDQRLVDPRKQEQREGDPRKVLSSGLGSSFAGHSPDLVVAAAIRAAVGDLHLLRQGHGSADQECPRALARRDAEDNVFKRSLPEHWRRLSAAERRTFWEACEKDKTEGGLGEAAIFLPASQDLLTALPRAKGYEEAAKGGEVVPHRTGDPPWRKAPLRKVSTLLRRTATTLKGRVPIQDFEAWQAEVNQCARSLRQLAVRLEEEGSVSKRAERHLVRSWGGKHKRQRADAECQEAQAHE